MIAGDDKTTDQFVAPYIYLAIESSKAMTLSLQVIYPNQKAINGKNTNVYASHASKKLKSMNNIQKLVTAAEVDPCMIDSYDRTLKKAKLPAVC
jgi:hypothetical protein